MRRLVPSLVVLIMLTLVGMLTVGRENDFGFACFLVFCAALLCLAAIGVTTVTRRSRS